MMSELPLLSLNFVSLLIEPLSAAQLIAAGVLVVAGVFNRLFRTYITYVLTNPKNGKVYVGRTSGFGEPYTILKRRLYGHVYIKQGFENPKLDRAAQGFQARLAIRGREQQLIDFYGGVGSKQVANLIRAVSVKNRNAEMMHKRSDKFFGKLYPYTGKILAEK